MALLSTACVIRTPHAVDHGAPEPARGGALGGPVTLHLRDGSTVVFPDGVTVREDSVVARASSAGRPSPARSVIDLAAGRPRPARLPSLPRSSAGRRTAAGTTRGEFVVGVVTDSVVTMQSTERRVNRTATVLANAGIAALAFVALVASVVGSAGQQE